MSARARGRRVRVGFAARGSATVQVEMLQVSRGRRILRGRAVARFRDRAGSFTWNGRANVRGRRVTDGYYVVRLKARAADGTGDARKVVLRRRRGRWSVRPPFALPSSCDVVESFALGRPVFGGRPRRPLLISYRLARAARVTVQVRRGGKVTTRFRGGGRPGRRYRLRLAAGGRPRGDYRVRLTARTGDRRVTRTLVARRL